MNGMIVFTPKATSSLLLETLILSITHRAGDTSMWAWILLRILMSSRNELILKAYVPELVSLDLPAYFYVLTVNIATCSRILYSTGTAGVTKAWGIIVNVGVAAMAKSTTYYANVVDYLHGRDTSFTSQPNVSTDRTQLIQ